MGSVELYRVPIFKTDWVTTFLKGYIQHYLDLPVKGFEFIEWRDLSIHSNRISLSVEIDSLCSRCGFYFNLHRDIINIPFIIDIPSPDLLSLSIKEMNFTDNTLQFLRAVVPPYTERLEQHFNSEVHCSTSS